MTNKLSFVNSQANGGGNMFPFTISANSVLNLFQFTVLYIPTAAQAATLEYTKPSGATWNFPVSSITPTISLAPKLNRLLGLFYHNQLSTISSSTTKHHMDKNIWHIPHTFLRVFLFIGVWPSA